jgi:hypothetical protein
MDQNKKENITREIDDANRIDYAIGVLETIKFLLETTNEDLLSENIEHAKKILPAAINQLKSISRP